MADALASGASALRGVEVQLLSRAQRSQAGDRKTSVTGFPIPELACGRPVTSTGYEAALMTPADGVSRTPSLHVTPFGALADARLPCS